jgi:hypothetical protein
MPTYSNLLADVSSTIVVDPTNAPFLAIFPQWINYAEDRIYRDLNMLNAYVQDGSASCTPNSRNFILPTTLATFLIIDAINVITPAATAPDSGTRVPLTPVSRDMLNWTWPSVTGATVPQYFAYVSQDVSLSPAQTQVIFGPWPDAAYRVEICGVFQPAALSATNPTTYLTNNLYDLMFAATMVAATAWQQNLAGAGVSDNPQMASGWEGQYGKLLASAQVYEARKRFGGASWTSKPLEPMAQPQRG